MCYNIEQCGRPHAGCGKLILAGTRSRDEGGEAGRRGLDTWLDERLSRGLLIDNNLLLLLACRLVNVEEVCQTVNYNYRLPAFLGKKAELLTNIRGGGELPDMHPTFSSVAGYPSTPSTPAFGSPLT